MKTLVKKSGNLTEKTVISINFDLASFQQLVCSSILGIVRSIDAFTKTKGIMSNIQLMQELAINMEIIKEAILISSLHKEIIFNNEIKSSIKEILPKVESIICELGDSDPALIVMQITERARPYITDRQFVKENW